jgi:hypothetical protein
MVRELQNLQRAKKWITLAFGADGGGGAVSGENFSFVRQEQQAGLDGFNDLVVVSARKVGASDAAGKQGVSGNKQPEGDKMQANRTLGVAGSVDYLGGAGSEADIEAVGEQIVGRGGLRRRDAQPASLHFHHFQQGQVVFVHHDRRAGEALELERAANVVNVGVGDENLFELEAQLSQAPMDAGNFVAGIDDDGLARLLIAQDGAVALKWADREGLDDHGSILGYGPSGLCRTNEASLSGTHRFDGP